jgi:hypothetical protein
VLTTLKVAEEGGLVARLWECSGRDATATLDVSGVGSIGRAERTDLLENNGQPLPVDGGVVRVPLRARGIATVRLQLAQGT